MNVAGVAVGELTPAVFSRKHDGRGANVGGNVTYWAAVANGCVARAVALNGIHRGWI